MNLSPSNRNLVAAILVCLCVLAALAAWAAPQPAPVQRSWLSHFVGDPVVVTFITAPPDMGRATRAVLTDAEAAGIVLRFGKEEIFFSFANIISVEPVR
jgi:hypothetical protein